MKNFFIRLVLTVAIFLSSCIGYAPPLLIPNKDDINKIQVSLHCNSQYKPLFLIEDRKQIEEIISFLVKNNKSWQYPLGGTTPIPPYKLELLSEKKLELVIWFGNRTLTGRTLEKNGAGTRVKYLSSEKIEKFVYQLGITMETCKY